MSTTARRSLVTLVLLGALLAGCAAPAAAPTTTPMVSAPTTVPVPPTPPPDPNSVVQAWLEAINSGDLDAAMTLMTPDAKQNGWSNAPIRSVIDWWIDIKSHYSAPICQQVGDLLACDFTMTDDGCITASGNTHGLPLRYNFDIRDGKIQTVGIAVNFNDDWSRYNEWSEQMAVWAQVSQPEEWAKIDDKLGKGGETVVKLCRDYADFVEVQAPTTAAAAQSLVDAMNGSDVSAALALLPGDAKFRMVKDEAVGAEQLGSMFDWLVGKETQYQVSDCQWQGIATQCSVAVTDGCMSASGAPDGLHGMMTFYPAEDGALRQVVVVLTAGRQAYETWLEAEAAWAAEAHPDELAQAEGHSQAAGEMAVKLCQEYAAAPKLDDATVAEIEAMVDGTMTNYSLPGLAIGVVKDGELVYAKGFGATNVADGTPATPQSLFGLASLSKMFTAAAIMQLVEKGLIDLDAPVTDYLPEFRLDDSRFAAITVRQLLAHTSGLPWLPATTEVRSEEWGFHDPDTQEGALARMVAGLDGVALVADPGGSQVLYSNTAFDVLGDIVATVSGQPYESYMRDNIFQPLGMASTTFVLDEADPAQLVTGYRQDPESGELSAWEFFPYNPQHSPSAGLISNVDDMSRWAKALLNGGELDGVRILEAGSLEEIWSPSSTMGWGGLLQDYGLGWILAEDAGHRLVWHVGGVPGFHSNLILAPEDGIAVVTMLNLNNYLQDEPWYATEIGTAVMHELLGIAE